MSDQRQKVFLDRYAKKGPDGKPVETTFEEMWDRVADAIADSPMESLDFANLLADFKFVPGGRILSGAGVDAEVTYYNCYVIPVETRQARKNRERRLQHLPAIEAPGNDSREAIFDTIGLMVDIMSRGGGVGINWSVLRPKGAYLKRVNGTSSGPVGWMDVASKAVGEVEQGGSRRGAAMFMLDDWHPDLLDFINAKRDMGRITNANISVAVSDDFMHAVKHDLSWDFIFPDTSDPDYNTVWDGDIDRWQSGSNDRGVIVYDTVWARDIWRKLAEAAHASGEPGVVFLDRYNKQSTAQGIERIISVNPCGEQGLGPYSVCNLGAMNLAEYIRWGEKRFDFDAFKRDVRVAVQFLDRVVDKNYYFLPENERIQKQLRRIGLSVMGLADALVMLGIRYGSPEAVEFTESVFREMKHEAVLESVRLAAEYGPAPAWHPGMVERPYFASLPDGIKEQVRSIGLRNLFLLTQAPTGTTSILAGVNSGIEPFFALGYWREDRTGKHWVQPDAIADALDVTDGPIEVWGEKPDYIVTAADVTVEEHIAMQAAAQKYIDSSVSKTINAPANQTVEEVEKAYTLAYESGCKGLAYYRDGSRDKQVLSTEKKADETVSVSDPVGTYKDSYVESLITALENKPTAPEWVRPKSLKGETMKVHTEAGSAYVTVNRDDEGNAVEVFLNVGKSGSDIMELGEAIGRLASLALRHGATLGGVANQLTGIGGYGKFNQPLPAAVGKALSEMNGSPQFVPGKREVTLSFTVDGFNLDMKSDIKPESFSMPTSADISQSSTGQLCADCQTFSVVLEEGCSKCLSCGWSAC